jgi:tetratricopeptide (TPR) repeat protein
MKIVSRVAVFATILLLSLQYFGCGGAELSSAKLYRQQRNYLKANDLLEQALKSDPTGDEVWSLYVTNLYDLKRYEKIAETIDTARLYAVKNRTQVEYVRRNTWVELYNGALNAYQQNPDSKEQQDAAIGLLESARKVAPEQPETYELLGDVYYSAGDTAKYIATYEEALQQVRTIHDQGVALGLMLKQDPAGAEAAIGGAPARKEMLALNSTDSVMVYVYPSKEAYLYFEKTKKTPRKWQLTGWKFTNSDAVGMQPTRISLRPYQSIAQYYLEKGNTALAGRDTVHAEESFDKVVSLLISVQRLDPSDESAASVIPDIYRRLGQTDKAKSEYERMLSERPSKNLYSAYGVVLMKSDDYPGAIKAFEKALEIDPSYENALFNLGAAYQNMAANEQKKRANVSPKDKKKLEEIDKAVQENLTKAIEYFEKVYTVNRNDYNTIGYLVENYDAVGNKDKSKKFLIELDNLKSTDASKEGGYWLAVGKYFAKSDPAKSADAFKKADEFMKK